MSAKLNLTEMLSANGSGNFSCNVSKANGNNGVIVHMNVNYHNPNSEPLASLNETKDYVYEGTPAEIKAKLETLGLGAFVEINE